MNLEEFEQVVCEVLERLPDKFSKILREEKIVIIPREKVPYAVRESHHGKIVFGVFVGVSKKNKRTFSIQTEPTRIEIYKESFEKVFGPNLTDNMRGHISRTIFHEIAHFFGFNEEEVKQRGY